MLYYICAINLATFCGKKLSTLAHSLRIYPLSILLTNFSQIKTKVEVGGHMGGPPPDRADIISFS